MPGRSRNRRIVARFGERGIKAVLTGLNPGVRWLYSSQRKARFNSSLPALS